MAFRTCTILTVAIAVFAGGSLGAANGMVLHLDDDGHLVLEAVHLTHAFSHAEGADHEPHDRDEDADHADLHSLIASCADSFVTVPKLDASPLAFQHQFAPLDLCLTACLGVGVNHSPVTLAPRVPDFRGGTAHLELACLSSVVLLV